MKYRGILSTYQLNEAATKGQESSQQDEPEGNPVDPYV